MILRGRRLQFALLTVVLAASGIAATRLGSQAAAPAPMVEIRPAPAGHRFRNGEILNYAGEWRLIHAGNATIQITSAGNEEHVRGVADSAGAVTLLYRVHDRFDSYFDPRTFCSSKLIKHTEEGLRRRDTQIVFDYPAHQAVLDETNLRNNEKKHVGNELPSCATDVVSGIFYAASLPLQPGNTYTFPLNDGGKTVNVTLAVQEREEVKTPAGTFKTVRVEPSAPEGVLKNKGHIWIWYTDDDQHIPVQARAKMLWGTLTLRLTRVDKPGTTPASGGAP
jgi:hypothetical protein